jgi:hypothetical protein
MEEKKLKGMFFKIGIILIFFAFCQIPTATSTITESFSTSEENQKQLTTISCGTIKILENLGKNQKALNSKFQGFLSQALSESMSGSRPTDPGGGIDGNQHLLPKLYGTEHFLFHFTNGTDGGNPVDAVNITDTNTNGVPDFIESSGTIFEEVWTIELGIKGFPTPPSDINELNDTNQRNPDGRYDIFIYNMIYYGYAYPEQYPSFPSYSFIAIKNEFKGYTKGLNAVRVLAAHEFFHAIQFCYDYAYDYAEKLWWMETTATYMEDEVYPDVNDNYRYLAGWFNHCDDYGLTSDEEGSQQKFGNFIFAKRLSEDFSDEIIKEVWTEMESTDGLSAINDVLITKNSTLLDEFSKFITANFFLEDMYIDGADYRTTATGNTTFNGVWLKFQYDAKTSPNYTEINESNANWHAWMDKWGTSYVTMKLDSAKPKYKIAFYGLDLTTNYLVKLVTKKNGIINETLFNLDGQKDGSMDLDYDVFDNVTLIMANAGNTDSAKPSWRVTIETLTNETTTYYHDVAITNVRTSGNSTVQGDDLMINVTTANQGNSTETFNVTVCLNETAIKTQNIVLGSNNEKTIAFLCNTTAIPQGQYALTARAEILPNETDTENNVYQAGMIEILPAVHDIAISNISFSNQKPVVGQNLSISVTVGNQGTIAETFDVSLNYTLFVDPLIGTQTITLEAGSSITLNFTWMPILSGRYEIKAYTAGDSYISYIFVGPAINGIVTQRMHEERLSSTALL